MGEELALHHRSSCPKAWHLKCCATLPPGIRLRCPMQQVLKGLLDDTSLPHLSIGDRKTCGLSLMYWRNVGMLLCVT